MEIFAESKFQESPLIYTCAENRRQCPRRSNIYLYPIWHGGIEKATFDIPYLRLQEKKKDISIFVFDKLLSRQKQERDGGGRC